MASRTRSTVSPCALSFSTSSTTWISRAWPPEIVTSPTPSTVSIARRICLSAISVSACSGSDPASAKLTTGSASGSTLVMIGGWTSGGRSRIACATFSRTSCAASLMSRSRTNLIVSRTFPSRMSVWISSIPEIVLSDCSVGSATAPFSSSGLAPGRLIRTWTIAGSAFGRRSTLRSRNENTPVTTNSMTSIVVKTGRLTQKPAIDMACRADGAGGATGAEGAVLTVLMVLQVPCCRCGRCGLHLRHLRHGTPAPPAPPAPAPSSPSAGSAPLHYRFSTSALFERRDLHSIRELLHVAGDDRRPRLETLRDFDAIAEPIAEHDLPSGELAVLHQEDAVGAV